jgi:hypothetical protein
MPNIPNIDELLSMELPGDLTLAESKDFIRYSKLYADLSALVQPHKRVLRIRFLNHRDQELPDAMTLTHFRQLCNQKRARIAIDDLGGGMKVEELV